MRRMGRAATGLLWGFLFVLLGTRAAEMAGLLDDRRPVVRILGAAALEEGAASVSYVVYDPDSRTEGQTLRCGLYCYPDRELASARAVRLFAHRITAPDDAGTPVRGGLAPGRSAGDVRRYTWTPRAGTCAASDLRLPAGEYYLYLVADDGVNEPVFAVSDSAIHVGPAATVLASVTPAGGFAYLP